MKWLTSRTALGLSVGIILLVGLLNWWLDGQTQTLFRAIAAAYIVSAVHWVIDLTPRLLERLRPVVSLPDAEFRQYTDRVIGERINPLLKLFAPLFAFGWALSLLVRVVAGGEVGLNWQGPLTELLMPIIEVVFSIVAVWRMSRLAQLSSLELDINLFDARAVYPFGELSFAYAAVISVRMLLQIILFGFVQGGGMAVIFTIASIASLLALILPIWSVHVQMLRAQIKVLRLLDTELHKLTRPMFAENTPTSVGLSNFASQVQALGSMRDRIAARWTWPVPDSVTAVQAVAVSGAPALLSVAKSYIGPLLGLS